MNLRILHSDFEINLVDTSFTTIEENNWFNDRMVSKYTYPIVKQLTDQENVALNFIANHYASGNTLIYDVDFYVFDKRHKAVMEIEKCIGPRVEFQIRYGLEEFPNFGKKLAELPLHKEQLNGETIYEHAEAMVGDTYPTVDYCFPQVFTDKFDTEQEQWMFFEGAFNKYAGGSFVENTYDVVEDHQQNKNIMQPMPFFLHVLIKGLEDAGYTLEGNVLEDPEFKKAAFFMASEYYTTIFDGAKQELLITADQYDSLQEIPFGLQAGVYQETLTLPTPGRYRVSGLLYLRGTKLPVLVYPAAAAFTFNGQQVATWSTQQLEQFILVDFVVEVPPGQSDLDLDFESLNNYHPEIGGQHMPDAIITDITVTQIVKFDANGDPIATLLEAEEIDLTKCVPDVTFGDFVGALRAWKNLEVNISGTVVTMNRVMDQLGQGNEVDLRSFEQRYPERTFNQGGSYLLKFQDINSDQYEFQSVLIDINGSSPSPFTKADDTKEIVINAIPLPLKTSGAVRTAHGFLDDNSRIQAILYDGLQAGLNTTLDPVDLLIPQVYEIHYHDWIQFLLQTIKYKWSFNAPLVQVADLAIRSTPFAYGKRFVVKKLSRTKLARDVVRVEIEATSVI